MTDAQQVEESRFQAAVEDETRRVAEAPRRKLNHPKGFEPGVQVSGDTGFISTERDEPVEPTGTEWAELLAIWGLDPEVYEVDPDVNPEFRAWDNNVGRDGDGEVHVERFYYYKARIRLKSKWFGLDIDELLKGIDKYKRPKQALQTLSDPVGLVIPLADLQVGKHDYDGVKGTIDRMTEALDMALKYYKQLVKDGVNIETVYLVGLGDIVEGCSQNYPSQPFTVELNRREQIRLARRLIKLWVVEFSKVASHVVVSCVGGNHGENRRDGKAYTTTGDNDDVAVFEMVAETLMENPDAFGHVNFCIPEERLSVVLDIYGVVVGFNHGHLAGRGADPQAKLKNWLKDMAFSGQPIGDAKLVVTGHYHHLQVVDHGPKTWIQCPAMDSGCYSSDTEVLTKRGWLTHDLVTLEDQVACFDLDSASVRWDSPSKVHEYDYEGVMHQWKGRSLDFLVTPNHRMVVKTRYKRDKPWGIVESADVDSNVWNRIPWAAPFENDTPDLTNLALYGEEPVQDIDAFLYLVGMYVSEGNLTSGHVVISQNDGEVADKIDKALASLGWEFTKHTAERPGGLHHRWDFGVKKNPHLCAWLAGNCFIYSKHKRLPDRTFLDSLSLRQKGVLYESLMDGDGCWASHSYHTTSRVLADQVQVLAIELGMKASQGVARREAPWSDKYIVFANSNPEFAIRSERHLTEVPYSGKVYCLTVPTGAYVTRHNGRAGICGNSLWWENITGSRSTPGILAFCVSDQYPMGFDHLRVLGFENVPAPE